MIIFVFIEIVDASNHFSIENGRVTLEIENKTGCHVMIKETKLKDSGTWGITIRTGQKGSAISKNYKHILTVGVVGRFQIIERCCLIYVYLYKKVYQDCVIFILIDIL